MEDIDRTKKRLEDALARQFGSRLTSLLDGPIHEDIKESVKSSVLGYLQDYVSKNYTLKPEFTFEVTVEPNPNEPTTLNIIPGNFYTFLATCGHIVFDPKIIASGKYKTNEGTYVWNNGNPGIISHYPLETVTFSGTIEDGILKSFNQ